MTSSAIAAPSGISRSGGKDVGFAIAIILILCLFFLPVPRVFIDLGIAFLAGARSGF